MMKCFLWQWLCRRRRRQGRHRRFTKDTDDDEVEVEKEEEDDDAHHHRHRHDDDDDCFLMTMMLTILMMMIMSMMNMMLLKIMVLLMLMIGKTLVKITKIFLPGHSAIVHDWVRCEAPAQVCPPFRGAGWSHVRSLAWVPLPHVAEHTDQSVQADQPPSTTVWNTEVLSMP